MIPSRSSTAQPDRLLGIEVIRLTAALAVLVWHYQNFTFVGSQQVGFVSVLQPFYSVLKVFYVGGFYGVQVFWCLSGFIFFWKYRDAIARKTVDRWRFFVFRFSRLYPLHFATLVLVAALQWLYARGGGQTFNYQNTDGPHFLAQLFMASNWGFVSGYSYDGPIWSVSIEVLIYIVFFMVSRYFAWRRLVHVGMLAVSAIAMKQWAGGRLIAECCFLFYLGGTAAIVFQKFNDTPYRRFGRNIAICAIVGIFAVNAVLHWRPITERPLLHVIILLPMVLYVVAEIRLTGLVGGVVERAGNMTYSSYLIHFPLQLAVLLVCRELGIGIPFYHPAFFVGFIVVTLILADATYRYFEDPAQRWMRTVMLRRVSASQQLQSSDGTWPR